MFNYYYEVQSQYDKSLSKYLGSYWVASEIVLPIQKSADCLTKIRFTLQLFNLQRLQAKILKIVDVSYGGENGFNQAIELAAESLSNVKFIQEKKLIGESVIG